MAEDILKLHFGPETGVPAPQITDAEIAMKGIIDGYGVSMLEVSAHPLDEHGIIDSWPDNGTAQ